MFQMPLILELGRQGDLCEPQASQRYTVRPSLRRKEKERGRERERTRSKTAKDKEYQTGFEKKTKSN